MELQDAGELEQNKFYVKTYMCVSLNVIFHVGKTIMKSSAQISAPEELSHFLIEISNWG